MLTRTQTVFQAVIDALPAKPADAAKVLASAGVQSTVPADTLATLLTSLARDDKGNTLLPVVLPNKPIDTGRGATSYRVDPTELSKLVHAQLAQSLPPGAAQKQPTVLIENGVGTSGLVGAACDRLLPNGYGFARQRQRAELQLRDVADHRLQRLRGGSAGGQ